jgi:hypothetical protein
MPIDRRKQIENLYHAPLEHPAADRIFSSGAGRSATTSFAARISEGEANADQP